MKLTFASDPLSQTSNFSILGKATKKPVSIVSCTQLPLFEVLTLNDAGDPRALSMYAAQVIVESKA